MSIDDLHAGTSHYTEFHHGEIELSPHVKYGIVIFIAVSFVMLMGVIHQVLAMERAENQQRKIV
eukprot:scaffold2120_cov169-Amphora_coffeaeformis.AAC.7